jgi:hypothetical protein
LQRRFMSMATNAALRAAVEKGVKEGEDEIKGWDDGGMASPYTSEDDEISGVCDNDMEGGTDDAAAIILHLTDPLHVCWRSHNSDQQSGFLVVQMRDGHVDFNVSPSAYRQGDSLDEGKALVDEERWELIVRLPQKHWSDANCLCLSLEIIHDKFENVGSVFVSRWERLRGNLPKLGKSPGKEWRLSALQSFIEGRENVPGMAERLDGLRSIDIEKLRPFFPQRMKRLIRNISKCGEQHEYTAAAVGAARELLKKRQADEARLKLRRLS